MLNLTVVLLTLMSPLEKQDVKCLARAIYHEARGEILEGKIGVASVVINRTKSGAFPERVCEVVYQPKQFTDIHEAKFNFKSPEWVKSVEVAVLTYKGLYKDPTNGAVFYYNPKLAKKPNCFQRFLARIGNHDYYTNDKA